MYFFLTFNASTQSDFIRLNQSIILNFEKNIDAWGSYQITKQNFTLNFNLSTNLFYTDCHFSVSHVVCEATLILKIEQFR